MLIPIIKASESNTTLEAIKAIRRLRKGITLGKNLTIKSLREQGRK